MFDFTVTRIHFARGMSLFRISVVAANESSEYSEDKVGELVIPHVWTITTLCDAQPRETQTTCHLPSDLM